MHPLAGVNTTTGQYNRHARQQTVCYDAPDAVQIPVATEADVLSWAGPDEVSSNTVPPPATGVLVSVWIASINNHELILRMKFFSFDQGGSACNSACAASDLRLWHPAQRGADC